MREFSHAFMTTICLFLVGPTDLHAQVQPIAYDSELLEMPVVSMGSLEVTLEMPVARYFPAPDTIQITYETDPPATEYLYTVTIDTTYAYPPEDPYYYEITVYTIMDIYRVSVENPHYLQRKGVIMVYEPDGSLMTCAHMNQFTHIYFPTVDMDCKCIRRGYGMR